MNCCNVRYNEILKYSCHRTAILLTPHRGWHSFFRFVEVYQQHSKIYTWSALRKKPRY
jgi:hypothetical protein